MGQHCCQEVKEDEETSVVMGELQAAMQAKTFDEGHSEATAAEADIFDSVASEGARGKVQEQTEAHICSFAPGETNTNASLAPELETSKALISEMPEAVRKWQVELLEERITRLRAELMSTSQQLQAARGDPKTPPWLEMASRTNSGRRVF
mmetsp:Transcript_102733/g.203995  ORF Transcript_102733/g.203995 Transcript_102733/m.203995 type:complete len:151 (-) Transcript_102733:295-747(-)